MSNEYFKNINFFNKMCRPFFVLAFDQKPDDWDIPVEQQEMYYR